ncbi:hypothetical protein PSN45_002708 [Yamadazyma tenuis]|uniref:uncharacterized protein n=1 Tax=Candida tenuis TaxID=2315449 RepID=UPI0027A00F2E|nr:hypothetical protein PSN45_002708 [Yamadazyma tenuis]
MSESLLKSKQFRSRKNLKSLSISSPILEASNSAAVPKTLLSPTSYFSNSLSLSTLSLSDDRSNTLPTGRAHSVDALVSSPVSVDASFGTIILSAKYDFCAENAEELSIRRNDYLKLIDRPGDGWLRVRNVSNKRIGLIPASYVKIAVNDLISPITHAWLTDVSAVDADSTADSRDLFDFEKHPSIKHVNVSQVLSSQDRFWYRVDLKMSDNSNIYLLKCYQDFYNLHYSLSVLHHDNLPAFPQPFNSVHHSVKDKKYMERLLVRCNELNVYMNKLVKLGYYSDSDELTEFLSVHPRVVNPENTDSRSINHQFGCKVDTESIFSKSPVTPVNDGGRFDEVTTPITPVTPNTPDFAASNFDTFKPQSEYVKVKVLFNNEDNDIIVLKVPRDSLTSLGDLKKIISYKIYKDEDLTNHYRLTVKDQAPVADTQLLQLVRASTKVTLNLVRIRGSI